VPVSRVIRTVRISGSVVTLGEVEQGLYLAEAQEGEVPAAVDLSDLLAARFGEVRGQAERLGQEQLERERQRWEDESRRRLEEAQARWEQERTQVRQQRFDEGFAAGVAAKEEEVREAIGRVEKLHEALKKERSQVLKEAERLVVDLAAALARRVIGVQAEADPKVLGRTMRDALDHLSERAQLVIKVHPDDLQLASRYASRWVEKVDQDAVLKVRASEDVGRGGCMIEGAEENLDARLEEQFRVLHRALRAAIYGAEEEDDAS
jgi:flagellar assembly protein FliH